MRLRRITLQHFRNISHAALTLAGRRQFLTGRNGQGKTNLLEAAGFITALRSFRAADHRPLIAHGRPEAALACEVEHERLGESTVTIVLRAAGKEVRCDRERVTRLGDYLGRFPTVVFSSQDQQLVRGAPALRRRWLDLALAAVDADYLRALQTYYRALAGRNSLLKTGVARTAELAAFERLLAPAAAQLIGFRAAGVRALAAQLAAAYARIAGPEETAGLDYAPAMAGGSEAAVAALFEKNRGRDALLRATQAGPHRDDAGFTLNGRPAADFASEGQQRCLVLALRLGQAAYFNERAGVQPVLLADDVLGELDPERRRRFWSAVGTECQVIATGTGRLEDDGAAPWQTFAVEQGRFEEIA